MPVNTSQQNRTFCATTPTVFAYITEGDGGKAAPLCRPVATTGDASILPLRRQVG
jgi:hypothetical protein